MTIEQVVFDIDNTFGPFVRVQLKKFQVLEAIGAYHLGLPQEQVRQLLKDYNNKVGIDNSFILQGIPAFREFYFDPKHEQETRELLCLCNDVSKIYTTPYEGVKETLSTLQYNQIKCAVWSDAPWFRGISRLIRMGIPDKFSVICAQHTNFDYHELYSPPWLKEYVDQEIKQIREYGKDIIQVLTQTKPNLEGLERIVAVTKITPDAMMMVGDSVAKDYHAQEATGMCAVLANVDVVTTEDYELLARYVDLEVNKSKSTQGQSEEGVKKKVTLMPEILYYFLQQNHILLVQSEDRIVMKSLLSKLEDTEILSIARKANIDKRIVEFHIKFIPSETISAAKELKNIEQIPTLLDSLPRESICFSKQGEKLFYSHY